MGKPNLSEIRIGCDVLRQAHKDAMAILERRLTARVCRKCKLKKSDIRYVTIRYSTRTVEYGLLNSKKAHTKFLENFVSQRDHDLWFAMSALEKSAIYIETALEGAPPTK